MNKVLTITSFLIMVAAQWFVPGQMIVQQEKVLTQGTPYKFKTMPMDPSDPLRGKYIYLNFEMNRVALEDTTIVYGDEVFVYIENDEKGFARPVKAYKQPLNVKLDYIKATARSTYNDSLMFSVPFTTFYMEESKAYPAEVLVREANRDSILDNCYGLVYVLEDKAVLADVIINDMSIKDYVARHLNQNTEE